MKALDEAVAPEAKAAHLRNLERATARTCPYPHTNARHRAKYDPGRQPFRAGQLSHGQHGREPARQGELMLSRPWRRSWHDVSGVGAGVDVDATRTTERGRS